MKVEIEIGPDTGCLSRMTHQGTVHVDGRWRYWCQGVSELAVLHQLAEHAVANAITAAAGGQPGDQGMVNL